ncbi:MAG: OLD family endonuclease, partial [Lachnospiraceae bacterium]|nr:OLD family endonuclease [Lachnospiraceae bacterium]
RQLCKYYDERNLTDIDHLPKVQKKNVLILKYYSFENYFLNPSVMAQLGIVAQESDFYKILFDKWNAYLHKIKSGKHLIEMIGQDFESPEDMKDHMEEIKIYVRGHNLFDIFYGPYKKVEKELLNKYISIAPREDFQDILDAIDSFIYFQNRKK